MKGKHIVVTGGAGFIGSNLVRTLAEDNANDVTVIDDLSTGHIENIQDLMDKKSVTFIKGSITDLDLLQEAFKHVDFVFHDAAVISAFKNTINPIESNITNVDGTLAVLIAARENHVKKVVFDSSASIYGNGGGVVPKHEEIDVHPLSFYAVGKFASEYYCKVFNEVHKLATISLRYFNVYGPRQDPSGEYAAVIPRFIMSALADQPFIVFGDGKQTRDFIFVNDIVDANILAAEKDCTGVYNIGSGKSISINDLTNLIAKITGNDLNIVYRPLRSGDILHSLADISKSKEELNFEPRFDIKDGLKETIKWFQMHEVSKEEIKIKI